ncbi:MAG: NAD(P)H-binding protein [Gaiellaceae bacterium]
MKILVTGGTGFVGSRIVHALRAEGRDVRALVRRPERGAHLASIGVELATGDVADAASLAAAADGCTHVVHLVAILNGKPQDFDRVMIRGTQNVIAAAKTAGVERFVLMSALGPTSTTKDLGPYFGAKVAMEQDTVASGLEYTIFRPSFVFGRGGARATFMKQVRYSPVVTVIGSGQQRVQPIWIDDVAEHFARALDTTAAANKTFELGGPDIVTWDELYRTIAKVLGKKRALAHVPAALARTGARATQWLPKAPLSADQVAMIEAGDNVVTNTDAVHTFQLPLVPLEDQIRRSA